MSWSQNLDSTRIQRAQRQQQQRLQQDVPVNIAFTYCGGFSPWITGMVVADDLFYRTTPLCCSLCASERKLCGSIFNYAGNYSCLLSNASETLALQSVSPPACSYCWVFPQGLSTLLSLCLCESHTCWLKKTASCFMMATPNAATTYSSPCPLQRHSGQSSPKPTI